MHPINPLSNYQTFCPATAGFRTYTICVRSDIVIGYLSIDIIE